MAETKSANEGEPQTAQVIKFVGLSKAEQTAFNGTSDVQANALEKEDEFKNYYLGAENDKGIIEPPYHMKTLDRLCQENNSLSPCIEAMVTNIDGTGFEFKTDDDETEDSEDDTKVDELWDFFNQPWPGESFITQRKRLRRDLERVGNAYIEVVTNASDEIVFMRPTEGKMMRLARLDSAVSVPTTVKRKGKEVTINLLRRERRYVQMLEGKTLIWFKEFGASRDLNKRTGEWAKKGVRLPAADRASSIIHLTALPDAHTPYGVPRWISQLPSVLGSRKAEEFNLEFFDNGGVPPVLIILQGGILQSETRKAFEQKTSGPAAKLNRVQVVEVEPSGGSLEKPTPARVTVERFGGERQNDSMFDKYDDKCEMRVRRAFRLPPIFVGAAQDYNFATAFASYTVAEAQVFKPERDEFDEIMTIRVIPAMGYPGYRMTSNPLAIADTTNQLKGIELAMTSEAVEPADLIEAINNVTGTQMKVSNDAHTLIQKRTAEDDQRNAEIAKLTAGATTPSSTPSKPPARGRPNLAVVKSEGILALATDMQMALRTRDISQIMKNNELVAGLSEPEQAAYKQALSVFQFLDPSIDPDGLAEIAGCTAAVMALNKAEEGLKKCECGAEH